MIEMGSATYTGRHRSEDRPNPATDYRGRRHAPDPVTAALPVLAPARATGVTGDFLNAVPA